MDLPWFLRAKHAKGASRPRHHDRVNAVGLSCHLGDVLDLSAGGLRVGREGKPSVERGSVVQIALRTAAQRVQVGGRVVWVRRVSWKRWEIGLQFIGVAPGVAAAIVELASFGYVTPRGNKAEAEPAPTGAHGAGPKPGVSATIVEVEDLYAVLGVARTADADSIHAAYRRLAREFHPDVNTSPDAPARFTHLNKAYSILKSPEKRQRYDALLAGCARDAANAA